MNSTPEPVVSVCIPAYAAQDFIAATIASVRAQTFTNFEVIVLDDCSADDTVAKARAAAEDDPRFVISVNEENLGPSGNWNAVVARAQGRYVKLLCSDDLLTADCLARQVAALDSHPRAAIACARRNVLDPQGRVLFADRGLQGLSPGLMTGHSAIRAMVRVATTPFGEPSVVLMRRAAMLEVGPFSARFGTLIDCEYYARLLRSWDVVSVDATLGAFLARPASWSAMSHRQQAGQCRALFRELAAEPDLGISRLLLWQSLARTTFNSAARRLAFLMARTGVLSRISERRARQDP
ncbi:MAG: glycosyltransferase family 2 protein [Acidimicrobiia bacterium]|nr:glycosyltransferase family 2 protein [Acidimicrobiia bacterium]